MLRNLTIRARLFLYFAIFLPLLAGLCGFSIARIAQIETAIEDLHTNVLAATRFLASIEDQIDEFRLAEAYRAVADGPDEIARDDGLTVTARGAIDRASTGFQTLSVDAEVLKQFNWYQSEWTAYLAAHDLSRRFGDP